MSSLRDKLLAKMARRIRPFKIDGEQYYARSLTAAEFVPIQDLIYRAQLSPTEKGALMSRATGMAIRMSVCDESGEPVFCDADIERLHELDHAILEKLGDNCNAVINALTVEDSAKN